MCFLSLRTGCRGGKVAEKNSPLGVNVEKHQGVGYEHSIMRVKEDVSVQSDLEEQVWVEEQEMCFPAGDV